MSHPPSSLTSTTWPIASHPLCWATFKHNFIRFLVNFSVSPALAPFLLKYQVKTSMGVVLFLGNPMCITQLVIEDMK